jgi:hypothetical protein
MRAAEAIAREFHSSYEKLAPEFGWETQTASRKEWDEVPDENRELMVAVAQDLISRQIVREGAALVLDAMYGADRRRNGQR